MKKIIIGFLFIIAVGALYYSQTQTILEKENEDEPHPDGVQEAMDRSADLKIDRDLTILESALLQYYNENNSYPAALITLQESRYLREVPQDPYTNNGYQYASDGKSFSLTTTKSDGTTITISR